MLAVMEWHQQTKKTPLDGYQKKKQQMKKEIECMVVREW